MDFRKDLELSWKEHSAQPKEQTYVKLILPANTVQEVNEYLVSKGLTEEYLLPKTKFDQT